MDANLTKALRRLADDLEKEEQGQLSEAALARLEALEARVETQYSRDEILKALGTLSAEERRAVLGELDLPEPAPEPAPEPESQPEPEPEPKPKRVRAGRKSGSLYMWDVDDKGRQFPLDIPHLYSGDDEPDEVELPDEEVA